MNFQSCARRMSKLTIGNVTKIITEARHPEFVPKNYISENCKASQTILRHLKWMLEKDVLKQDMFLFGPPGFKRRHLALQYAELTNSEIEYVALNRDTTEADLKQRREIVNGSAVYFDQSAVRAALFGRTLILEGIEKAERNVLPVLNNLLENREMHLEDGRLLIPAQRFDTLLKEHGAEKLHEWKLERVHESFRVIAIGIPVPRFAGNPLDPPLRSRFQARNVSFESYQDYLELLTKLGPNIDKSPIEKLLNFAFAVNESEQHGLSLPQFPINNLSNIVNIWNTNPSASVYNILHRLYPYNLFSNKNVQIIEQLLGKFHIDKDTEISGSNVSFRRTVQRFGQIFVNESGSFQNETKVNDDDSYFPIEYQSYQIKEIKDILIGSRDVCLVGPRGCGKSIMIRKVIKDLGLDCENIILYNDMTSRDLVQQRVTSVNGDTVWKFSTLISAALNGKIAILDGLHKVHTSTLSIIHRLSNDRELQLHDGRRLIGEERYNQLKHDLDKTDSDMENSGILKIHKDFRMVALAESPNLKNQWFNDEILSSFLFQQTRMLTKLEEMNLICAKFGLIGKPLKDILDYAYYLKKYEDESLRSLSVHLSTRKLMRIAARYQQFPNEDVHDILSDALMVKFLPLSTRTGIESSFKKNNFYPASDKFKNTKIEIVQESGSLQIGNTKCEIRECKWPAKVPKVLFYDVPHHYRLMESMLKDFMLDYHILLVGNQGVGKNKIADKFLQLLNRSREYIQLHRDTTVQTLTIQPTIRDGRLVFDDSPLVRAIKEGHVLVVDEADKAPVHVTSILKNLVECGEMVLSDGRRIVKSVGSKNMKNDVEKGGDIINTHPDFRMIVLANRPGFPFLGNDFFGSLSDVFSCHAVDNPPAEAEINLLRNYGPNVPDDVLKKLVDVFGDLRQLADQNLINYPFSTREVVNIVKHIQEFPNSNLLEVMMNVFDFDVYTKETVPVLNEVLQKHGFCETNIQTYVKNMNRDRLEMHVERISGLNVSSPKHGKEDPKNEPHVGGNTWAGGTGGRDTAGLGGKGGPYRLDKGHRIHQLSDEEKSSVPEHVQKAAREMGQKAFKEKLQEIKMSEYDAMLYEKFSNAVSKEVQSIRTLLDNLEITQTERVWFRHQTSGVIDDGKLIDGLLGDKNIYRKRLDQIPEFDRTIGKPKRVRFVVDVSGSMYRFNSYDGRLDRELELAVLVMESFKGFEDTVLYDIIGHSGDTEHIQFVNVNAYPTNNKERLKILREMVAHSQYCWSGDNTIKSSEYAIRSLADEDCDDAVVVIVSDANLKRYNIEPKSLFKLLTTYQKVQSFIIFIGSLDNEAIGLVKKLPHGKAWLFDNVSTLPTIMKQIFSASIFKSSSNS